MLRLHEIVERLYFHCSLSVCLSVCQWTKYKPNVCTVLDAVFAKWLLIALARFLLNLVTLGQRSKSQWRNTHILLIMIKMKFGRSLWNTIGRFVFKFHKIRMRDDVIMTSFKFSPNNCPYLQFYWTYKLRTWNQYTTL